MRVLDRRGTIIIVPHAQDRIRERGGFDELPTGWVRAVRRAIHDPNRLDGAAIVATIGGVDLELRTLRRPPNVWVVATVVPARVRNPITAHPTG